MALEFYPPSSLVLSDAVRLTNDTLTDLLAPKSSTVVNEVRFTEVGGVGANLTVSVLSNDGETYHLRKDKWLPADDTWDAPLFVLGPGERLQAQCSNPLGMVDIVLTYLRDFGPRVSATGQAFSNTAKLSQLIANQR